MRLNYKVQMVIDNDRDKEGSVFEGKIRVTHPSSIEEWADYFVIIATDRYADSIYRQLEGLGFVYGLDFIRWKELYKGWQA